VVVGAAAVIPNN